LRDAIHDAQGFLQKILLLGGVAATLEVLSDQAIRDPDAKLGSPRSLSCC
jgi:hypothetical protein